MPLGALLGGIGGILGGNKAANGAMDAGGALVGGANVAYNSRMGAYDAARGLDTRTLRQILATNQSMYRTNIADQTDAYNDIYGLNRRMFQSADGLQRSALNTGINNIRPLVEQGDQYRNAMAYNDGFGDRPEGYAEFTGTPGYQFRRQEADDALNNRLAAMGSLNSGAAVRRAMEVADGMASQEHQLHYNRLAAGANQGANARYNMANFVQGNADNRTALRGNYANSQNAARQTLANNRTNLRSGYGAAQNAARAGSLANQINLLNMRGEAGATRATDAANAYASARMGATAGQTQAMQAGFGIPGGMLSSGLQLAGGIAGMGGFNGIGNALMNGTSLGSSFNFGGLWGR